MENDFWRGTAFKIGTRFNKYDPTFGRSQMFHETKQDHKNTNIEKGTVDANDTLATPTLKDTIEKSSKKFITSTSLKGISRAYRNKSRVLQLAWLAGTMFGLVCAIYILYAIMTSYFRYDTVTDVKHCSDCKPKFPDITVCNLNMLGWLADLAQLKISYNYDQYINILWHKLNLEAGTETELDQLFSTTAYFNNLSPQVLQFMKSEDNINDFVHQCVW